MPQIDLSYAQTHLAELIEEAARGKEIIITQKDGWAFKIVPVQQPKQRPCIRDAWIPLRCPGWATK